MLLQALESVGFGDARGSRALLAAQRLARAAMPRADALDDTIRPALRGHAVPTPPAGRAGTARAARRAITFIYLGRSPAFGGFVASLARALAQRDDIAADIVVAEHTDLARSLAAAGAPVHAVPTFRTATPHNLALGYLRSGPRILSRLTETGSDTVVTLMPHVWSPLLAPRIRRMGLVYATVIHDVDPHPGDPTAWATSWLARDARHADAVLALSRTVAERLARQHGIGRDRLSELFHPDLEGGDDHGSRRRHLSTGRPFRVLFFGRIMAYKGLDLLIDAVARLRAGGIAVELGVAGEGRLGEAKARLEAVGAEVINRWLEPAEVAPLLARYDAMVCSHVEASQSGVAALAFGNGLPVVATPVGGVREQVVTGVTGILADDVTAASLARAIRELASCPALYDGIVRNLAATSESRSMDRFLARLLAALPARRQHAAA